MSNAPTSIGRYEVLGSIGRGGMGSLFLALDPLLDRQIAVKLLRDNGFVANFTDVVAVEVPDTPGGLAMVLKVFADNDVNVEYMYGFVEKHSDKALLVFRFEDTDVAQQVLARHSISIVTRQEIEGL